MRYEDRALCFSCGDEPLYGVLSMPQHPLPRAVVIVVGGPQYRAGSHRQFTLIARGLAMHGIPVLRFDYRGMGDSGGDTRTFENVGEDIHTAVDCLLREAPFVQEVVLWGLCDGASAALFYAHRDARISGLVLVNPWVRTDAGAAQTYLKHYYRNRFLDAALWKKIGRGEFDYTLALQSFGRLVRSALQGRARAATGDVLPLPDRMLDGLRRFQGSVLVVLSGDDLTAREFSDLMRASAGWRRQMHSSRVQRFELRGANHTFSRREWREQLLQRMREWLGIDEAMS
ncbi:hydrolase 1, exosortase A system-associated [Noviherbaspirillum massiliense]|uniref:hydrolase 1, exosortase A system-associated n=1 Tax=Noviherbaspirillum massiliense TaxID=1465823 RepID=UPI000380715B|nr:hydrolase 1, exosortase A system-associated [Noviherbaspirillum massiliense]